jgi:hypothetical protein
VRGLCRRRGHGGDAGVVEVGGVVDVARSNITTRQRLLGRSQVSRKHPVGLHRDASFWHRSERFTALRISVASLFDRLLAVHAHALDKDSPIIISSTLAPCKQHRIIADDQADTHHLTI